MKQTLRRAKGTHSMVVQLKKHLKTMTAIQRLKGLISFPVQKPVLIQAFRQ